MSIYLTKDQVNELIKYRDQVFSIAEEVYQKFGIDLLANDTLNALSIHEIAKTYDSDYNTNFHRNKEDAQSKNVLIEHKCSTVKPSKKGNIGKGGWQFHAQGTLNYSRYIFAIRRKDNLKIARMYDISSNPAITVVQQHLEEMKQKWINRGKPNHDGIVVPEKLVLTLPVLETLNINNCDVIKI